VKPWISGTRHNRLGSIPQRAHPFYGLVSAAGHSDCRPFDCGFRRALWASTVARFSSCTRVERLVLQTVVGIAPPCHAVGWVCTLQAAALDSLRPLPSTRVVGNELVKRAADSGAQDVHFTVSQNDDSSVVALTSVHRSMGRSNIGVDLVLIDKLSKQVREITTVLINSDVPAHT
jgi:hypothetical protein